MPSSAANNTANENASAWASVYKELNSFMHSMGGIFSAEKELEYQLQIGSQLVPEYPCRSLSQAFCAPKKKQLALRTHHFRKISSLRHQYYDDHFIAGIDTEHFIEACFLLD